MSLQNQTGDGTLERRDLGPDEDLVRRIVDGETSLYEVIMRRHNRRLYRVARSILRSDDDAMDVMQDAYMRGFSHLSTSAATPRSRRGSRASPCTKRSRG